MFKHRFEYLVHYHAAVIREMSSRGYHADSTWLWLSYRGKKLGSDRSEFTYAVDTRNGKINLTHIYEEHNDKYLKECLENLKAKGAKLVNGESVSSMLMKLAVKSGL